MSKEKRRSKIQSPNSGYIRFLLIKFLNLTKKRGGEKYFFSNEYHRAIYPLLYNCIKYANSSCAQIDIMIQHFSY
jgi:hypothetical protein